MLYRENTTLGRKISTISFGGAALSGEGGGYGFGAMSEDTAESVIKAAWDEGITLFDTAPIYGFGLSEERLGRYLPKEAIIVSKAGVDWHSTKRVNMSNDPKVVEKMLRESLKRLKREQIDIYMIHWPDPRVDIRFALEVLASYQEKGAIAHLGLCNTNLEDLAKAKEVCKISVLQSELSALNTKAFDELNEEWKSYVSMGWGTFDKGILTGRVTTERKFSSEDCRSWAPWWSKKEVAIKIERVKKLQSILDDYSYNLPQFCLSFGLFHYGISSCLVGSKSVDDLVEVTSHLQRIIPGHIMEEVLKRWSS